MKSPARIFRSPLQALLWEQWRMTRPVALLPLIVALADGGLWLWCHVALDMPVRQFIDLADAFVIVMLALTGLMLLSQPDRRLELRLATSPRLLRLPVRGRALLFTSLPLRVGMAALFGALSLLVHHGFYGADTDLALWPSLEFFLCCYLLLYSVAAPMSMRGDRASMIATGLAAGVLVLAAKPLYGWTTEYPIPALLLAGAAALAGGAGMHGLRRCGGTLAATTFSFPAIAGGYSDIRDIPRFATPLEAQVWFERRRHGWLLPALSLLIAIGCAGYHLLAEQNRVINLETFYDFIATSLMLLPVAAVVVAGVIAVMDARALNGSSGRFQFVRPMPTPLLAQARLCMAVRSSGYSVMTILGVVLLLFVVSLSLGPHGYVAGPFESPYDPAMFLWPLAGGVLLAAVGAALIQVMGNRILISVCILVAAYLLLFAILDQSYFEKESTLVALRALVVAMLANVLLSWRSGLLRWWPALPGMLALPLVTAPYGLFHMSGISWAKEGVLAAFVLCALTIATLGGLPLGFHLRRSQSFLPPKLDTARPNLLELRRVGVRMFVVTLLMAAVYGAYRLGLSRTVELARENTQQALDSVLKEEHPIRSAYVTTLVEVGRALEAERVRYRDQLIEMNAAQAGAQYTKEESERLIIDSALKDWMTRLETAWESTLIASATQPPAMFDRESKSSVRDANNIRALLEAFMGEALNASAVGDASTAAQYLAQALSIEGTMESLGIAIHYGQRWVEVRSEALDPTQQVFDEVSFDSDQLSMLQARLPQRQYDALSGRWLREDMLAIGKYMDLCQFYYMNELENDLSHFWYPALGVLCWDQLASYRVLRSQAMSLQGKGKVDEGFLQYIQPLGTPQTWSNLNNQGRLRYPEALESEARNEVLRTAIAVLRFELEHGHFPDKLEELVGEYLEELPVSPYELHSDYYHSEFPDRTLPYVKLRPSVAKVWVEDWRNSRSDSTEFHSASFSLTLRARK